MKKIKVSGSFALVDDEDYPILSRFSWRLHKGKNTFYAKTTLESRQQSETTLTMHRLVMGYKGKMVDHADGNGLNNQKENLRICTNSENARNQRRDSIKGAVLDKRGGRWLSQISFDKRRYSLGTYATEKEAGEARDKAAIVLHGKFASLNYPMNTYEFDHEDFKKIIMEDNRRNKSPIRRGKHRNKYRGVHFNKKEKKYYATLSIDKKSVHIGSFDCEEEAVRAWDSKCYEVYGDIDLLNFPF